MLMWSYISAQVDSQMQITGSILQPNISGNIKLSHGEAHLPHDKGSGSAPNRLASNQSTLPGGGVDRAAASKDFSRFFSSHPAASRTRFSQPSGKKASMLDQFLCNNVLLVLNTLKIKFVSVLWI